MIKSPKFPIIIIEILRKTSHSKSKFQLTLFKDMSQMIWTKLQLLRAKFCLKSCWRFLISKFRYESLYKIKIFLYKKSCHCRDTSRIFHSEQISVHPLNLSVVPNLELFLQILFFCSARFMYLVTIHKETVKKLHIQSLWMLVILSHWIYWS